MKAIPFSLATLILTLPILAKAPPKPDESKDTRVQKALLTAWGTNVDYTRQWFDQNDMKSLQQTGRGMLVLAKVIKSRSESAGLPEKLSQWEQAARTLARSGQEKSAIEAAVKTLEQTRWKKGASLVKKKGITVAKSSNRDIMKLLEATLADTKTSVAVADHEAAADQAVAIAEITALLKRNSKAERWLRDIATVMDAAHTIADGKKKSPAEYRTALKQISAGCASCHDRR